MSDDDEVIEAYLEMRRQGVGERSAARYLGATHREIMAWFDMNPDHKLRLEDALIERLEKVEEKMWEAGQAGDIAAAKTVLESHAPAEWTRPSPEMILRVQAEVDALDIPALHERLSAEQRRIELQAKAIEATNEETTKNG